MAVFAANVTDETVGLLDKILAKDEFVKFAVQNKLNLSDNTMLIRLALINLIKHIPTNEEVIQYKVALIHPNEFDDFLENKVRGKSNVS